MSTIYADNIQPNLGSGVSIPGHVIQHAYTTMDDPISTSSSSDSAVFSDISMTTNAGSRVYISFTLGGVSYSSSDTRMQVSVYVDGANVNTLGRDIGYTLGDIRTPVTMVAVIPNVSAGNHTFNIHYHSVNSYGTVSINNPWGSVSGCTLNVMEIAQ